MKAAMQVAKQTPPEEKNYKSYNNHRQTWVFGRVTRHLQILAAMFLGFFLSGVSMHAQATTEELNYIQAASQTYVIGTLMSGDLATATIWLNKEARHVPLRQGVQSAYGVSKGWLAFTAKAGATQEEFFVMDVAGGIPVTVLTADRILRASWRPGNSAIAVAYQQANSTHVAVYDIDARSLRQVESFQSDRPFLFWSRDGETLNFVTSGSGIAKVQSYDARLNARTVGSVKSEFSMAQSAKPLATGPVDSYTFLYTDGSTDPTDDRTPLILIHGIEGGSVTWQNGAQIASTDTWNNFVSYFGQGCNILTDNSACDLQDTYRIYEFIYQSDLYSVYDLAGSLRNQIDAAVSAHLMPDGPVVLLAHSMGGLIARAYMTEYKTNQGASNYTGQLAGERVLKLITLGTPHHGTPIASKPSRDTLLANADALVQFVPGGTWTDVAHLMENAGTIAGLTTVYKVPNRDDLWWDNFDHTMGGNNDDSQPFIIGLLNSDTTYDGKISAFYGYYDSTLDSDYEAARENVYGWPPSAQRLPYINNETLAIGVIMANGLEDISGKNLYPRTDGFVPNVSAFFQGHSVAEVVECPGYNHVELHDGRADYLPCNATGTFKSKNVLDAIHDRLTAIRPFAVDTPASIVSPANGTILNGSSVTFQWNLGSGVMEVQLGVGTSPGRTDIFTAWEGIHTSQTVSGLPTNGQPVYVTLQSTIQGKPQTNSYTYTASGGTGLYALTVSATSGGTVTSGDGYINCGSSCAHVYSSGTNVSLNAAPASGWSFGGWGGACSGIGSCSVTMAATTAVTANFTTSGTTAYTLTVNTSNPSSGVGIAVSPTDIDGYGDGPTSFSRTYNQATLVTLTAPATAVENNFSSWSGCDKASGVTCTVTLTADRAVTANYTTPDAPSVYEESVLYSFCSMPNCTDGYSPESGLILDNAGNLYGTAQDGGGVLTEAHLAIFMAGQCSRWTARITV
jgi:pimeloyl-ACP methyl ester carboxylesterase